MIWISQALTLELALLSLESADWPTHHHAVAAALESRMPPRKLDLQQCPRDDER